MVKPQVNKSRRALLNTTLGLGALGATLPSSWTKPIVNAVVLPTHAMMSPPIDPTNPSFSIEKIQSGGPNPATMEGDVIEYNIIVTNTGDVDLTGVIVTDTLPDGTVVELTGPDESLVTDGVLEVNEVWMYETSYTVTLDEVLAGADLTNSVSAVTNEAPDAQDDSVDTPVMSVECPALVVGSVSRSGTGSGAVACTLNFMILSDTTTPLDITDISFTTPSAAIIDDITLVDGTTFSGATDSMGAEVSVAFTSLGGACISPGAITIDAADDVTFSVEATCAGGTEPVTAEFTLTEIAALL